MEITEVYPKIFRMCMPLPLDLSDVNIYLIAGEVPTLIDGGIKTPFFYEAIQALMKRAGVRHLARILLTHWHSDHSGTAAALAEDGTEIFISAIDYQEWMIFSLEDSFTTLHECRLKEWGVPEEKLQAINNNHCEFQTLTTFPSKVSFIHPGDCMQVGDYRAQAIFTPGHTEGHLTFWLEQEKLIFSGDLLLPEQISFPGTWLEGKTHVSGLPAFINSIKTLESLGAQRYFPAHGAPDVDPLVRCRIVLDQINNQITKHIPAKDIYTGASRLCNGNNGWGFLFYHLYFVFGWETVQKGLRGVVLQNEV